MYDEIDEILIADVDDPWMESNPAPVGGRAALGTLAGLGLATLIGATWARLERETWFVNQLGDRSTRLKLAGGQLLLATTGAAVAAKPGTRLGAAIGAALGVVAGQAPLVIDPMLIARFPVLGNIWQYSVPIGAAILGVNAVSR